MNVNDDGAKALEEAIANDDLDLVARTVDGKPNLLNGALGLGRRPDWTLLHMAAARGSEALLKVVLDCGAQPNARDRNGQTPLHLVTERSGGPGCAKVLVEDGADINAVDNDGRTPISYCNPSEFTRPGEQRTQDVLIAHGAVLDFVGALTFGYFGKCRELMSREGVEVEEYFQTGPYLCEMFVLAIRGEADHVLDQQGRDRLTDDKSQAVVELLAANRDILRTLFDKGAPRQISEAIVQSLCDHPMLPVLRELVACGVKVVPANYAPITWTQACARDEGEIGELLRELGVNP
jgi:hypothetical protein